MEKFLKHFKNKLLLKSIMTPFILGILFYFTSCKKDIQADANLTEPLVAVNTGPKNQTIQDLSAVAYFDANLNTNQSLAAYATVKGNPYTAMAINPERISVVNDPVYGSKRKVMLLDVRTGDTGGLTENPRAQVQTPMNYLKDQTVYAGFSVRFTAPIWTYFLTFSEFYGAPYAGTSPFRLAIQGSDMVASTTISGKQTNLWKHPVEPNEWFDFVYKEVFSANASKGQVQVWVRKQGDTEFAEIVPLTHISTITSANLIGPNYHKLACYYDKSNTYTDSKKTTKVTKIKMYLANHKVGSSFDLVAPGLVH